MKKYFTLDDLYTFLVKQNKDFLFDSNKTDSIIAVQLPATFESDGTSNQGLMPVKLHVCHTKLNANGSYISEENMEAYKNTLFNKPILGNIIVNADGVPDFHSHDMEINDDGTITYIERPVGVFPESCNPRMEYDEEYDKNYLAADGYIYEEYGNQAASILRESKTKKVSCEIAVLKFSYNAKEKYLDLQEFYFNGVTILGSDPETGKEISEGMKGSKITIESFAQTNNSYFSHIEEKISSFENTISEIKNKINSISSILNSKEGGERMTRFEELLQQYKKTVDDISFEYEGLTDEELENKFKEAFESGSSTKPDDSNNFKTYSREKDGLKVEFKLSHEDIRGALYNLIATYEELDDDYYYINTVYDDSFVFESWWSGKIYGQKYTKDEDNVSLEGERYELYRELLTATEKAELDSMRADYSEIKNKLSEYRKAELNSQRKAVMEKDDYAVLFETEEYKELKNNMEQYSVEELDAKLISLVGKYALSHKTFSEVQRKKTPSISVLSSSSNDAEEYDNPFKTLFTKEELTK